MTILASPLDCDPATYRPLRVSCIVVSAILHNRDGLNLDGLLQYGAFVEWKINGGDVTELPPINGPKAVDFDMPVQRWREGDVWGWHTSDVIVEWEWSEPRAYRGPTPIGRLKHFAREASVNVASGTFKATDLRFESVWPRDGELAWHVLGNAAGVAQLLTHVAYIGKKHNLGAGKVRAALDGTPEWCVEEVEHDYSLIDADGRLARRMPARFVEGGRPGFGPIRAPNWHRSRWVESVEAGSVARPPAG